MWLKMNRVDFVKSFQRELATNFNLGYQNWWSKFLFHYSDISNIISILNSAKLYSRNKALALRLMQNDNADNSVISHTDTRAKEYVRLYFGALTPTQYHNEGFKSRTKILHHAHCPVPVFLLLNFVKILSRTDSHFSSGNIASAKSNIYNHIEDLDKLEFKYIYHRDYIQENMNKQLITYCRHAEVLIPDELNIYDYIEYVMVRSEAEKQTLLYHLNQTSKQKLKQKIRIYKNGIFYADRFYIENIELVDNRFSISFSRITDDKFDFVFYITNNDIGLNYTSKIPQISIENRTIIFQIKPEYVSKNISLKITIDGNLAYEHNFGVHNNLVL